MIRNEAINIVREACIKTNPDLEFHNERIYRKGELARIHLADIIFTYLKNLVVPRFLVKGYVSGDKLGAFDAEVMNIVASWNLRTDSLKEQSDETLEFLAELLS